MRRFLFPSEPWVLPFGRNSRGLRITSHNGFGLSPRYYRIVQPVPQQEFRRCRFLCQGRSQRGSTIIDDLSLSSPSVALGTDSTIYALSTAPGRAAIAIIRISGPACLQIYRALCPRARDPKQRMATVRALYDPTQAPSPNTLLDPSALVLYFPSPRTVTGEDVLELHVHGGPATVKAVLNAIEKCNDVIKSEHDNISQSSSFIRYAEPGEFTRRAFMNDVLDLPQIEALGETLNAETEQQRRLAVRGANTTLSARYEDWRQQLLYARGELEALIDFSEDQHFDESPQELIGSVSAQVAILRQQIRFHIQNASKGELLRNGIKIALLGAPNAGKSSLLNRVVGKEAAIVSTEEGTTRDIVDVGIDLGGWYCKIGDMAGLRSSKNEREKIGAVELEGIRRAKQRALESDVVVVVLSVQEGEGGSPSQLTVDPEVVEGVHACQEHGKSIVVAINKTDRLPGSVNTRDEAVASLSKQVQALFKGLTDDRVFSISCREAERGTELGSLTTDPGNIQSFLQGLISVFEEIARPEGIHENDMHDISYWEDSLGVTHRQQSNLKQCLEHLERFLYETKTTENNDTDMVNAESDVDIVTAAENLRFAAESLAQITGRGGADVEDVLGVVFEKFCVGK
ncbi:mitochondrial GTPase (Mss1), putative [Talaromyces stipitatus ATCC 10500]|uniref:Mitochondrial GTPase (Mss1), putative n=1 Tax=Talaromyces stipitatus (strain ATCC 10500 / CBS 375.48 / QM 6759 / NRRL 1006) TaxID=441959 RepID=B8MTV1_TALSN|nr:mitochondrial GTPase (Mss1), putative [Talaromyces stipitatus ATCC 10500]EED12494.1 mitochondrial GTPase (Mss1), putative [Talaromyces stipitatus ATCC 10500]